MSKSEIEEIVKDYLTLKNIDYVPKNEGDIFNIYIDEFDNVFSISVTIEFSIPKQTKACSYINAYKSCNNYGLVLDKNGKILIYERKLFSESRACQLDENNIIVPIINDNRKRDSRNRFHHFRIQNSEANLINIFETCSYNEDLLKDKIMICEDNLLYNFETGTILCDCFDRVLYNDKNGYYLELLADYLRIPDKYIKEFTEDIGKKMKEEDLLIGCKIIKKKKSGFEITETLFAFINKKGNFVSSLYYMDNYDLKSIDGVNSLNIKNVIEERKKELNKILNEWVLEEKKKEQILSEIRMKLSI